VNKEIKEKWIAALESGDYEQGTVTLRTVDGRYCCLGVLCELAIEAGVKVEKSTDVVGRTWYNDGVNMEQSVPPPAVLMWAGLPINKPNPEVSGYQVEDGDGIVTYESLAEINDYTNAGFAGIAKIIREEL
jgi:hypothetical protein